MRATLKTRSSDFPAVAVEDIAWALAAVAELSDPDLGAHHRRTAVITRDIASIMILKGERLSDIVIAGLLHDIGALATADFEQLKNPEHEPELHALVGASILEVSQHLKPIARIVRDHHRPWRARDTHSLGTNLGSHIVHLADRVDVMMNAGDHPLARAADIKEVLLRDRGSRFSPDVVDAFLTISEPDAFWFRARDQKMLRGLLDIADRHIRPLSFDELSDICAVFGLLVDCRSPFTATHSFGVAAVAGFLGAISGLGTARVKMLEIAGHLHDVGKLMVPLEILHKPGRLTSDEMAIVRQHPYHSGRICNLVPGFEQIARWVSHHHEHVDGSGYPYKVGERLTLEARILAAADKFVALIEDRPYRAGLSAEEACKVLEAEADRHHLDVDIVSVIKAHLAEIFHLCRESQLLERRDLKALVHGRSIQH